MKPLQDVVILDLTRLLPGAVATMLLRRAGATVIKVEEPVTGDYARTMPPLVDGIGAVFRYTNGGKKSVALNLKQPAGREGLLRLADRADVLVEGFRPGVMERLGLGYEVFAARHPRLIYATLSGYPRGSPRAGEAGHDINYLATMGALDPPHIASIQIADIAGGSLPLVNGILLALLERHRTGRGSRVDISMTEGIDPLLIVPRAMLAAGRPSVLTGRYPCYNLYQCKDGSWIAVGALEQKFWAALCEAVERPEWIPSQFSEGELPAVREFFASKPAQHWIGLTSSSDCCVTPVLTLEPMPPPEEPAPSLGEHTREVMG